VSTYRVVDGPEWIAEALESEIGEEGSELAVVVVVVGRHGGVVVGIVGRVVVVVGRILRIVRRVVLAEAFLVRSGVHADGGHDHQQGHNLPNLCKFYANLNLISVKNRKYRNEWVINLATLGKFWWRK
jgi:hypothetical protein